MEKKYYWGTGRRKEAVAQVRLYIKDTTKTQPDNTSLIIVNNKPASEYFGGRIKIFEKLMKAPLELTNTLDKFGVITKVCGGGISAQADAIKYGIAKALLEYDSNLRPILRQGGFLKRDARVHERKKYGRYGRRRGFQWTKR